MSFDGWKRYVPVAQRRKSAEIAAADARKAGLELSPVTSFRGAIAKTFWGKAWCDNLERYSDFANRIPRGRTYLRNGSVIHLEIKGGEVRAMVRGSRVYDVNVNFVAVPRKQWQSISADCAGSIDSLVELLQGRLSNAVMDRICRPGTGLFPLPKEIRFSCSCPDWASMCKHVAAVLYGVGTHLDRQPEVIFALRRVDPKDLVARAGSGLRRSTQGPHSGKVLNDAHLADLFGIEIADGASLDNPLSRRYRPTTTKTRKAPMSKDTKGRKDSLDKNSRRPTRKPAKKGSAAPNRLGKVRLAEMIEEATVDAYGDSELTTGWYTVIEEHLALPFDTTLQGLVVRVVKLDLRGESDIVAICMRGRQRQPVRILDLPLPLPRPEGAEWIEAYRRWIKG